MKDVEMLLAILVDITYLHLRYQDHEDTTSQDNNLNALLN